MCLWMGWAAPSRHDCLAAYLCMSESVCLEVETVLKPLHSSQAPQPHALSSAAVAGNPTRRRHTEEQSYKSPRSWSRHTHTFADLLGQQPSCQVSLHNAASVVSMCKDDWT